jgi:hypothetical protein
MLRRRSSSKKLDWSKMLGFDQLEKVEEFARTRTIKQSGAARVGKKMRISKPSR